MSCWNMINDKEIGARDVMPHKGLPYCDDNWDYSSYDFLLDYSALENCVKDIEEYLVKREKNSGNATPARLHTTTHVSFRIGRSNSGAKVCENTFEQFN